MTIDKIKNKIINNIGNKVKIVYNGSRNRVEEYSGVIVETYNYIFIVRLDTRETMSFSYTDVLTSCIELNFAKSIWVYWVEKYYIWQILTSFLIKLLTFIVLLYKMYLERYLYLLILFRRSVRVWRLLQLL